MKYHPIEFRKHNPNTDQPTCQNLTCISKDPTPVVTNRLNPTLSICQKCYAALVKQPLPYDPRISKLNFILYITEQYEETWKRVHKELSTN